MPGLKLATGLGMMALTIIIHALFMVSGAKMAKWRRSRFGNVGKEKVRAEQYNKSAIPGPDQVSKEHIILL